MITLSRASFYEHLSIQISGDRLLIDLRLLSHLDAYSFISDGDKGVKPYKVTVLQIDCTAFNYCQLILISCTLERVLDIYGVHSTRPE